MVTFKSAGCSSNQKPTLMQKISSAHPFLSHTSLFRQFFAQNFNAFSICSQKTALHWSACRGHVATCQLLISSNADLDSRNIGCCHLSSSAFKLSHGLLLCCFCLKICFPIFVVVIIELLFTSPLIAVNLKSAGCLSSQKQMLPRGTGASLPSFVYGQLSIPNSTCFRHGLTPLSDTLNMQAAHLRIGLEGNGDVIPYLRSIGAPY